MLRTKRPVAIALIDEREAFNRWAIVLLSRPMASEDVTEFMNQLESDKESFTSVQAWPQYVQNKRRGEENVEASVIGEFHDADYWKAQLSAPKKQLNLKKEEEDDFKTVKYGTDKKRSNKGVS
jgi:hypothetical protein